MKSVLMRRFTVFLAFLVVFGTLLLPAEAVAQGNGRGRGQAKKVDKFVNGHDARDGRWDGRGPRRGVVLSPRSRGRHLGWTTRRQRIRRQMIRRNNRVQVLSVR
jgi:hypothetical protein